MKAKVIILAGVLVFLTVPRLIGQPLFEQTTYPPAAINPVVHTADLGVTNALEWIASDWMAAWALWGDGTIYTESRHNWEAVSPDQTAVYPHITLFDLDAASDLRIQELDDYASFEMTYNGTKVTMWIFGNADCPAITDFRWIGASGIGRDFINDEPGYLVRLDNDPATDRQFFNAINVSPGDPAFDFDFWYGLFGHYSFNNSPFVNGLPNARPWNHEVYELCTRRLGGGWEYCSTIMHKSCKERGSQTPGLGDSIKINGIQKRWLNHVDSIPTGPPPFPDPVPRTVVTVDGTVYSPNGTMVPLKFIFSNHTSTTLTFTYTVNSKMGALCNPSSGTFPLQGNSDFEVEIVALSLAAPGQKDTITVTETNSNYSCYAVVKGALPLSRIELSPGNFTANQYQTTYLGAFGFDPDNRPLAIPNPGWSSTGALTTLTGLPAHKHIPEIMQVARFTADNIGEGDIIITSGTITKSVHVTVIPAALLSLSASITEISCPGQQDGIISTLTSGGKPPYSYLWSNGATNSWVSGLSAGTHEITVSDANSSNITGNWSIIEPDPMTYTVFTMPVMCHGGSDGGICLNLIGGTAPYNYIWSNGQTTACNFYLSAGIYYFTVSDRHGCMEPGSATITQPDELMLSASINPASCRWAPNGSINLSVTGGYSPYTYYWSNNEMSEDIVDLTPGLYSVMVHDAGGCSKMEAFEVGFIDPHCQTTMVSGEVFDGQAVCYDAIEEITVAGDPPMFVVYPNGHAILKSAGKIVCLPGMKIYEAGTLHASITTDGSFCPFTKSIIALADPQEVAGDEPLENNLPKFFLKAYPNPTTGYLTLELSGIQSSAEIEIAFFNLLGRKVLQQNIAGSGKYDVSMIDLPAGIYILRTVSVNETGTIKIIRQ